VVGQQELDVDLAFALLVVDRVFRIGMEVEGVQRKGLAPEGHGGTLLYTPQVGAVLLEPGPAGLLQVTPLESYVVG